MLRLNIVLQNPAVTSVITWFGVIVLAVVAALIVALWVVVVRGRASRDIRDFDDSANDPAIEDLRHTRLVVQSSGGPQDAVVAQLERTSEPDPPTAS